MPQEETILKNSTVLFLYNKHRGGGGADNACRHTMDLLREAGLKVVALEKDSNSVGRGFLGKIKAAINSFYPFGLKKLLKAEIKKHNIQVVHCHELYPFLTPWVIKWSKLLGCRTVVTLYDYRLTCATAQHFRKKALCHQCHFGWYFPCAINNCRGAFLESWVYALRLQFASFFQLWNKYTDAFIVLSPFAKSWLVNSLNLEAVSVSVIPCALDLPKESDSKKANLDKTLVVGFAARLVPEKGYQLFIEACQELKIPFKLAIPDSDIDHPLLATLSQDEYVLTASRNDIWRFYDSCRLIVVPSLWYETFGLVAAEAMAMDKLVVMSDIGALSDLADDGVSATYFSANNKAKLKELIRDAWQFDEKKQMIARSGGAHIRRLCDSQRHVAEHLRIYFPGLDLSLCLT